MRNSHQGTATSQRNTLPSSRNVQNSGIAGNALVIGKYLDQRASKICRPIENTIKVVWK